MTDHSQEAVAKRISNACYYETEAGETINIRKILEKFQPGDQLPNELVAVSTKELRILTKLAAAVQKDDKPHMAKLLSDLEDWQNGR